MVTVVLLMSPAIKLLVFFFPVMAVLLAAYLYRRNLPGYRKPGVLALVSHSAGAPRS